ncbi:hypothetical protein GOV07_02605 [Candidatus Woesearchaeota archaeon]|nr:hypothetical protein [Candidatus Woesearchaeota archaeon]
MSRDHRILPLHRRQVHHHRPQVLGALLFLGLFTIFTLLILASKLSPAKITAHALTQNVSTRVNVTGATFYNCTTDIPVGTSLKSFNCIPLSLPFSNFMNSLSSSGSGVKVIYKYTPWSNGKWQAYNRSLSSSVVQMNSLGNQDGFYFLMDASETFLYEGFLPFNSSILIRPGWNLVGYPTNRTKPLALSIQSINTTYEFIETLEGTEEVGAYLWDVPPPGNDTLFNTTPFHGFWIRNTIQDNWMVLR